MDNFDIFHLISAVRIISMSFKLDTDSQKFNRAPKFIDLIERIRQCVRKRELTKAEQQQHMKNYSIIHYIEHMKQSIHEEPLMGRMLFQFYNIIKNFSSKTNRMNKLFCFLSEYFSR